MREVPDFRTYLTLPRTTLYGNLAIVMNEICAIEQEIALCEADSIRNKTISYQQSTQNSATGRAQEADIATSTLRSTLIELYADKATLIEEKHFLLRLLDAQ